VKITSNTPAAQMGGMQANAFQLTNSAKIIDIVINKMYTNKPGAVIRELAANAWDAHCEADNRDKPFEIHLPTWIEKTFMIRDYGIGIPHERFENIYTNIGGSTKDTSDDLIGGFGLGSKTPFTMVDSFTVENWRDGEKSTWLCFKDAGNPQVTMLSREPSTEPTGVKVSFVFEEDEVLEFTNQLTKQLKYFPTKPIITGGEGVAEWDELPDGWETKDYFYSKQRNVSSWNRTHYVVMGNVAYDLNDNMFSGSHALFRESLTIKVPIGAVDIPPSRENLEYTTRTKKYIGDVLAGIKKKYNDEFLAEIKQCKDYLSLRKKFHQANGNLISLPKFTFEGDEYTWSTLAHNRLTSDEHTLSIKHVVSRYTNVFRACTIMMTDVATGLDLYINDLGIGATAHINAEHIKIPSKAYIIDPTKGTKATRQALFDADLATATEFFGVVPKLLSTVIGLPTAATKGTRAKPDQIFKVTSRGATVKASVTSVTDIPTSGYMLPMSGWDVEDGKFKGLIPEIGRFVDELDEPVYLVRKHTRKDVVGLKDASHLSAALDKLLVPRLQQDANHTELQNLLSPSEMRNLGRVEWRGVDNAIYLLLKFHARLTKSSMNGMERSCALSLVDAEIKGSAFVSERARSYINTYNKKWKELVSALGYGWNSTGNFKALQTFIITENK